MRSRRTTASTPVLILGLLGALVLADTAAAAARTIRIMPLGDSITRGRWGSTWRLTLRERLTQEAGVKVDFVGSCPHAPNFGEAWTDHYPALKEALEGDVEHEGWGALQIADLIRFVISEQKPEQAKRFLAGNYRDFTIEELLAKNPADIILLMIGTNDIFRDVDTGSAPERLDALVGKIVRTSPAALFVASIPPISGKPEQRFDEKVRAYNARIPQVVRAYQAAGFTVSFVDVFGHLGPEDMLSDNLHPNMRGDRKIGNLWFTAIFPTVRDLKQ